MKKMSKYNSSSTKLFYVYCPYCGDTLYQETSDNSGCCTEDDFQETIVGNSYYCESCDEEYFVTDDEEDEDF